MTIEIDSENRGRYLYYSVRGQITLARLKELVDRIRHDCEAAGVRCAMTDGAALEGALSLGERFKLGEYIAAHMPSGFQLAGVAIPIEGADQEFTVHVVSNRGRQLRYFTAVADAEAWFDLDV